MIVKLHDCTKYLSTEHDLYKLYIFMTSCYMQILQEANDELEDRIKRAEKELEESTAEMNRMTDEYTKLKVGQLGTHTSPNFSLNTLKALIITDEF